MSLGTVFLSTWQDYKRSFRLVLKTFWWFSIFPAIIFGIIALIFILFTINPQGDISFLTSGAETFIPLLFLVLFIIYFIVIIVLNLFLSLTLYFNGLFNGKGDMSFGDVVKGGAKHFWRYVGLIIIMVLVFIAVFIPGVLMILLTIAIWSSLVLAFKIILVLLIIALFILALIFYIYLAVSWIFSPYILIEGKQGIVDSLRVSKALSRGKWWKTFGYVFLMGIILYGIAFVISIFSIIINFSLSLSLIGVSTSGSTGLYVFLLSVQQIVKYIVNLIIAIILTPIFIFYIKNFYLEIKKSQKSN